MNPGDKLLVCLYSDPNFLAVNILENLLSKNCLVNVVTNDINGWEDKTRMLSGKNRFGLCEIGNVDKKQVYDYVIFCSGFLRKKDTYSEYKNFCSLIDCQSSKNLILLPFETYDVHESNLVNTNDNSATVYLGDLLGPRIDLDSDLLLVQCINEIIEEKKLTLAVGEVFYPLFVPDVVRLIVKWLFAFGPYGKEILLLGSEVSSSIFWQKNEKLVGKVKLQFSNKIKPRISTKGHEIQWLGSDLNFTLTETYRWLSKNWVEHSRSLTKKTKLKPFVANPIFQAPKGLNRFLLLLLLLLASPLFILIVCFGSSFIAYKEFTLGKDSIAESFISIAKTFAVIGGKESKVLSYIPLLGSIYRETSYASDVSFELSEVAGQSIPLTRSTINLFDNILGDKVYNPSVFTSEMKANLSIIYDHIQLIQNRTKQGTGSGVVLAKMVSLRVDFEKYKNLISQGEILVDMVPEDLGQVQSKTYLILFENNMELRPTGGFIGSYGLVTFDKGRLSDFNVSDVYSADGQLNGHVEPPAPIKNYLGEANWWLRDSNWDPDFPTSARRAEWFLNKEIGQQVDGVVAIDLFPIREILKSTGPIFLADYDLDITSENLYEKIQAEVQNDFFPGTHKKASFLTALSRSILGEISRLNLHQKDSILLSFYKSLEERRLQLFVHNTVSQAAIGTLGWDGAVVTPTCGNSCYADMADLVEANVGVDKANYFVKRSVNLEVNINSDNITRRFTLDLTNSANPGLGLAGKYKAYIRLLVSGDASNINVESISGQSVENLTTDVVDNKGRKEIGVLVEVNGGQSQELVFSWRTQFSSSSITSYGMYIRKQAGVDEYPMSLNFNIFTKPLSVDSRFALTNQGTYLYNTTLANDLFARFLLK